MPLMGIRSSCYLCDEISNEGDIRVEFLQAFANVADHRQDVATTQQMNHSVQQSLLQLQLRGETKAQHCQLRSCSVTTNLLLLKTLTEALKNLNTPAPWRPAASAPSQKAWWAAAGPAGAAAGGTCRSVEGVLMFDFNCVLKRENKKSSSGSDVVPHPVELNALECGRSATGSTAAPTLSSPPISRPP